MSGAAPRLPSVLDVYRARRRLRSDLAVTPLRVSRWLSHIAHSDVFLKLETVQPGGSFKIRGAMNALLAARERAEAAGARMDPRVVTGSAGNHGRAMAASARQLGVRVIVYTPSSAPETKKAAIRELGAELRDHCADYDAAEREAMAFARQQEIAFVSGYNHPDVIAGAGTIGLEIVEQLPQVDIVLVPLGGGGLAGGVGLAVKAAAPRARVVGVEVEASTAFTAALASGRIVPISPRPTLADGLTGNLEPGSITFPLVQRVVDEVVVVTEQELRAAMRGLFSQEHLVAEGAGAAALAAVLAGRISMAGMRGAIVVSGSNVDGNVLQDVLHRND
jgi:threonine dehydratase